MKNKNLHNAKKAKNDEFYTKLSDIENELKYYKKHFKNKTVLMNCDDPQKSNFYKFFVMNFEDLELKKIIATHYEREGKSYKLEISGDTNGNGRIDIFDTVKTPLEGNGDFRSEECIELLKEADIVVTNPPFSLFREFVSTLIEHDKKFLIIGNKNSIITKNIFPLIKENKLWLGFNPVKEFVKPDNSTQKFGNIGWYTNLKTKKRNEELILYEKYSSEKYPKYDNYDAIEVKKVKEIPMDFEGVMGVPISFLDKYCPDQFEIIGISNVNHDVSGLKSKNNDASSYINAKKTYARIFIRRKTFN